jgi:hypothetical protein
VEEFVSLALHRRFDSAVESVAAQMPAHHRLDHGLALSGSFASLVPWSE